MDKTRKTLLRMVALVSLAGAGLALIGCATIDGAGQDIEKLGDEIQEAAN